MKSGFSTDSLVVQTSDGHNVVVLQGFTYTSLAGKVYEVAAGAQSDGLSIPQAVWNVTPPFGQYWMAGVLHDYLYRRTETPKQECDDIFREAMIRLGVDRLLADAIYEGVHLGGAKAFEGDRAQENAS